MQKAKEQKVSFKKVSNFLSVTGKGVRAKINSKRYYLGNIKLMKDNRISVTSYQSQIESLEEEVENRDGSCRFQESAGIDCSS